MRNTWLALGLLVACTWAAAAGPQVRVSLRERQPVLVGQQVHLLVTVMTPNYFTSAPPFPTISIPGTIVTMPDESGDNTTETVGGVTYASIRKTYVFSAQQAGDFTLPPLKITFTYGGDDGKPRTGTATLPPFRITAKLPPGAAAAASAAGGALMPVARVTVSQQYDRPEGSPVHAGDALVRTLDTYAAQTQAMMIPPPHPEAPPGVRVFAADPELHDVTKDREGFLGGHRIDRLTYVFEKPGTYTLPPVRVGWYDAAADRPRVAEAPGRVVTVMPAVAGATIAPEAASGPPAAAVRAPRRWPLVDIAAVGVAVLVAAWLLAWAWRWWRRHAPAWAARRQARRAAHRASEGVAFEAVLRALRVGPAAADAALLAWSRHLGQPVSAWAAAEGDADLVATLAALRAALYGGAGATFDPAVLRAPLTRVRAVWLARRAVAATHALPALNP